METTRISLLVLVTALISIPFQASAADKLENYVAIKGGIYSPSTKFDLDNFNGGSTTHFDKKTGFAGEIAAGRYFLPTLAIELGAGYFESEGSPVAQPGSTKLRVVPLIATGKVLFPISVFEPYGLYGIGAYITDLEVHDNSGTIKGSTEVTYGLHAGAGFNINISDTMFVGVEGKYLWAEPSFGGQHIKLDGFTTSAVIGFRM
jgi:opacity protein-like surface antigen